MSAVRRRDTVPEMLLRRTLWARGARGYRVDYKDAPGRPDVAFTRQRVAVFVDGAFWHGHPSAFTPRKHGVYWDAKITRNCERDRAVDAELEANGWRVLRFWDFDIAKDPGACAAAVESALHRATRYAATS